MPTTTQSSRLGMHDALRRAADAGRIKERQTDIPSAPRSRQAMVVGERTLVKAGLRPPPSAAGGLDRACHPAFVSHQAFDGKERLPPQQASCQLFSLRHLCADSDNHPHQAQNAEWPLGAVRLRDICPSGWARPIAAPMHSIVQVFQFLFERFSIGLPCHAIDSGRSITREREIAPL